MKNISQIITFACFAFCLIGIAACQKDDGPDTDPGDEQEVITTVQLTFTPAAGGNSVIFVFSDTDGPGGQAPLVDQIDLAANTTYEMAIEFIDNSDPSDPEFITEEVQDEAEEHLVCYGVSGATLTATAKDQDADGNPLGLIADVQSGAAGSGTLTISLKHLPSKGAANPCSTGETDVEAAFALVVN